MLKNNTKEAVKLAMKGVFRVEDFKELQGEIEKSPAFKVQINIFESCNPLILCGFDQKLKRECNGWMKVATSDFWRNYGLPKDRDIGGSGAMGLNLRRPPARAGHVYDTYMTRI